MEEDLQSSDWPDICAEANWAETSSAAIYPWSVPATASASSSATAFEVKGDPPWRIPVQESANGFPSWSLPAQSSAEVKAASMSKSHSQAEKRRRDRINAQLGILRKLIPKSEKMDKAALLGSTIEKVKDLRGKAMEISKAIIIPSEFDEVTVDVDDSDNVLQHVSSTSTNNLLIRASVSCDDRPEVFSELIQVLEGLKLSIVRADISSVGGRVKNILVLCHKESKESVSLSTIKQALNAVLSRISSSSLPSNYGVRSRRQRFFLPPQYSN